MKVKNTNFNHWSMGYGPFLSFRIVEKKKLDLFRSYARFVVLDVLFGYSFASGSKSMETRLFLKGA